MGEDGFFFAIEFPESVDDMVEFNNVMAFQIVPGTAA